MKRISYVPFFLALISALLALIWMSGCKDEVTNNTVFYENSSLTDPSIMPQAIFTLPANNAVGPFEVYNAGDGSSLPHFVVQFNKLISKYAFSPGVVTVEGFDDSVVVEVDHFFYPSTESDYSDIFGFVINWAERYGHAPYAIGKTYTVTINTSLVDINGNQLQATHVFSYMPEPSLRLVDVYPDDGSVNLPVSSTYFSLSFNSQLANPLPAPISFSPSIAGRWAFSSFDSTDIYFKADLFPAFGTTYTLTVPVGTTDKFGNSMVEEFQSTFTTAPFEVLSSYPANGSRLIPLITSVTLVLSGPADTSTMRAAFGFSPPVSGSLALSPDAFSFVPAEALMPSTEYTVTLSSSITAWDGSTLLQPTSIVFTTEPFRLTTWYPYDGARLVPRWTSIAITTNLPLDPESVINAVYLFPSTVGTTTYDPGSLTLNYIPSAPLEPYQLYTVTVTSTLRSAAGDSLQAPVSFSFTTGP